MYYDFRKDKPDLLLWVLSRIYRNNDTPTQDIQAHKRFEEHRRYIIAYGSEEEKESLMIDDLVDLMIGMGGVVMLNMMDEDLDGEIALW